MGANVNAGDGQKQHDTLKWVVVGVLLAGAIVGNAYYADQSLFYRVLALVLVGVAACALALKTSQGAAFVSLAKDARTEIRKVVWPTHQETTQTTLVVAAVVVVMALILWALDALLGWLASLLIG